MADARLEKEKFIEAAGNGDADILQQMLEHGTKPDIVLVR